MFITILSATMIDEFQHKVYENSQMTIEQLNALYAQLELEYFGEIDNLGLSYLDRGLDWVDIHHLFESPMYYVEYALTGVVALDFWQDSKENWDDAFRTYIQFCLLYTSVAEGRNKRVFFFGIILFFLIQVMQNSIDQGIERFFLVFMDNQTGRFIDQQQIFVLVQNIYPVSYTHLNLITSFFGRRAKVPSSSIFRN